MPGRLGPRFALEAGFLLLLAVAMGLADLSATVIVLVMAVAWLLVAAIEWTVSREGRVFSSSAARRSLVSAARSAEEQAAEEKEAVRPRWRFWEREKAPKRDGGGAGAGRQTERGP